MAATLASVTFSDVPQLLVTLFGWRLGPLKFEQPATRGWTSRRVPNKMSIDVDVRRGEA
ncbi:hypothetical protein BDP55DRAFT_84414 [Colletotrichum godetiae]|uniref:Uncharacterized protein n=1 Tax=Colletotrichum godetiae TaxID=1209918 RepID=A0AAJ0AQ71_9PEZI|nr:uncharacterized protein BDP55DRAFT_84414 [Colletotrichum godetiae]KAK1687713.1 hypothetical protein BDP55DRAFT_84414 [Colletotrichum godetiae]